METPVTHPHVAVCPSAGIGHLTPFLRLASMLANATSFRVTLVIIRPTLSSAETNQINTFLATHPHISISDFHVLPCQTSNPNIPDPFLVQYNAVSRSAHLLTEHLSTLTPPLSAVFSDLMLASGINKPLADLGITNFTVITTSARFFSLMANLPHLRITRGDNIEVPGLETILADDVPPPMCNTDHIFTQIIETNCRFLHHAKGILLNSFDFFEPESISALQTGKVLSSLPPIFPVGPLIPFGSTKGCNTLTWLDNQPSKSVVFVSFGSRTAMTNEQIRELGEGLDSSGMRFLWVIKTKVVDKEEKEGLIDLLQLLGETFFEKTKGRGLVVKEWVNQEEILDHDAVGGFLTHCGWNSVMEAAQRGVPTIAWPLHGDQRVNAGVAQKAGLGIWERSWGWGGKRLVKAEEIAEKIQDMMTSEKIRCSVERAGKEARKAWEVEGSSRKMFDTVCSYVYQKDGSYSLHPKI